MPRVPGLRALSALGLAAAGCLATIDDSRLVAGADVAPGGGTAAVRCTAAEQTSGVVCVAEDAPEGIFVAPAGVDANDGTRARPVAHVSRAFELLSATRRRIYVCGTEYLESIALKAGVSGSAVRGGFDCATWTSGGKTALRPLNGIPLQLREATGVVVSDFAFIAPAGVKPGESSIAVFVASSEGLTFLRIEARAGDAVAGTDGHTEPPFSSAAAAGFVGEYKAQTGSATCGCPNRETSIGGIGGWGSTSAATLPTAGLPTIGTEGAGGGCPGAPGGTGAAGATAARPTSFGTLDASGWHPGGGAEGEYGHVGQGGGGARYTGNNGGGGGGGGCGGCGGAGGTGGIGGGGSFGFLSFASVVEIFDSTVRSAGAGAGGRGAAGQLGQAGGPGGTAPTCAGGAGGTGGKGGTGAGGAGGVSVAVGYSGTAPKVERTTTNAGSGADGGLPNGQSGVASPITAL